MARTQSAFTARRRQRRAAARLLMRARTRSALTPEQRAYDPLTRGRHGRLGKLAIALGALVAALGAHVAVLVAGHVLGTPVAVLRRRIEQAVRVEMREPPRRPPPPVVEEKQPPPPAPKPVRPQPVKVARPATPPAPAPPRAPVRVVGLSLESTTEGGNGPAFAVGETRAGETAARAPEPRPAPAVAGPVATASPNAVASRIPVAGVNIVKPRVKGEPRKPRYPEVLKAQGIECDVDVLVSVGADGKVTKVKIITAAPNEEFNQAARAAAEGDEWEPATRDGVPFSYTINRTYRFRLEDQ
ncbi:MAG TPA: energy transducer TonB [Polyangia bacterium]|nr:energy transducer TonB [Polyangia bacterium]